MRITQRYATRFLCGLQSLFLPLLAFVLLCPDRVAAQQTSRRLQPHPPPSGADKNQPSPAPLPQVKSSNRAGLDIVGLRKAGFLLCEECVDSTSLGEFEKSKMKLVICPHCLGTGIDMNSLPKITNDEGCLDFLADLDAMPARKALILLRLGCASKFIDPDHAFIWQFSPNVRDAVFLSGAGYTLYHPLFCAWLEEYGLSPDLAPDLSAAFAIRTFPEFWELRQFIVMAQKAEHRVWRQLPADMQQEIMAHPLSRAAWNPHRLAAVDATLDHQ